MRVQWHQSKTAFVPIIFISNPISRLRIRIQMENSLIIYSKLRAAAAFSHQSLKRKKFSFSFIYLYTILPFRSALGFDRKCLCAAHVGTARSLYTAQWNEWINERREWSLRRHRPKGWVPSGRPAHSEWGGLLLQQRRPWLGRLIKWPNVRVR